MIAVWISIDDTDSTKGMCTTYLISELVAEFDEYDILGYPRLVRLNPNIPWKTRGNGAVCIRFGRGAEGTGMRIPVCAVDGTVYRAFENGVDAYAGAATKEDVLARVKAIVERFARFDDKKTNPGIVVVDEKPAKRYVSFYRCAVRSVVQKKEAEAILQRVGAASFAYKNGRGLIGATAALCYEPDDRTYEIIAYREKKRWGTPRGIGEASVIAMDRQFQSTFDNYDYVNSHVKISPNSPCPVLFGIRGDDPHVLPEAMSSISSEAISRWTLFETNQGTDEHLQRKKSTDVRRYDSVIISGAVTNEPVTLAGGHVIFSIADDNGAIDCAAYEPTKQFRNVIKALKRGDAIDVYGSVHRKEGTVNLEKMYVRKLVRVQKKVANPLCHACNKRMKSRGRQQRYKCPSCGATAAESDAVFSEVPRTLTKGFYEVPVCARRHLSMPLKRIANKRNKTL